MTLEWDAKALRAQIVLQSPTAPLHAGFGGFNINRGSTPASATAPDANVFQGGRMGNNNIMRGFQTPIRGRGGFPHGGAVVIVSLAHFTCERDTATGAFDLD